jgi:hypothetical protein
MNKEKLITLVELAGDHAKLILIKRRQPLIPQWLLVDKRGKVELIATPWSNERERDIVAKYLRKHVRESQIEAYSFVIEAWAAIAPEGWKEGDPRLPNWMRPDRTEIVVALATDGSSVECREWTIQRDHLENVRALAPSEKPADMRKLGGWMAELLSPKS